MVKFKVPIKEILQNAYYQYELTSSDYNPTVDTTITITCTCKNVLGNPIANKTLELLENGVSQGTSTTNANGIATWTVSLTSWIVRNYRVENATLTVKPVGFKEVSNTSITNYTIYRNDNIIQIVFSYPSQSLTTSWTTLSQNAIGNTTYRPKEDVDVVGHYGNYVIRVTNTGTFMARAITGTTTTQLIGQLEYTINY